VDVYLQRGIPHLSAEKHHYTTMLNSVLACNLHTELKGGFYKRIHYNEAILHQLKYTKS
jgi:hypothetical protein